VVFPPHTNSATFSFRLQGFSKESFASGSGFLYFPNQWWGLLFPRTV